MEIQNLSDMVDGSKLEGMTMIPTVWHIRTLPYGNYTLKHAFCLFPIQGRLHFTKYLSPHDFTCL